MTDITTRLSDMSKAMYMDRGQDEIDALLLEAKEEIERLREALKPFSAFASVASSETMKKLGMDQSRYQIADEDTVATGGRRGTDTYRVITFGDLRRASAAQKGK